VLGLAAPIESHDVGGVLVALALETPVASSVDVDTVVVGADGKVFTVRGECHNFNPLGGVLKEVAFHSGIAAGSDRDSTVVTGNSQPLVVSSNGTRALRFGQSGESGSATASGFSFSAGNR